MASGDLMAAFLEATNGQPALRFTVGSAAAAIIGAITIAIIKTPVWIFQWGKRSGIKECERKKNEDRLARVEESLEEMTTKQAEFQFRSTTGEYSPTKTTPELIPSRQKPQARRGKAKSR